MIADARTSAPAARVRDAVQTLSPRKTSCSTIQTRACRHTHSQPRTRARSRIHTHTHTHTHKHTHTHTRARRTSCTTTSAASARWSRSARTTTTPSKGRSRAPVRPRHRAVPRTLHRSKRRRNVPCCVATSRAALQRVALRCNESRCVATCRCPPQRSAPLRSCSYEALAPEQISFKPLNQSQVFDAKSLMKHCAQPRRALRPHEYSSAHGVLPLCEYSSTHGSCPLRPHDPTRSDRTLCAVRTKRPLLWVACAHGCGLATGRPSHCGCAIVSAGRTRVPGSPGADAAQIVAQSRRRT